MKKILFILTIFFASLLNAEVITKTNTKVSQGEGYGATYEEALSKALADAVGRMNGVKLNANTFMDTTSIQDGKDRSYQKSYNDQISKQTGGKFDSYDVIRKTKTAEGHSVVVEIKKTSISKSYKTPGLDPNNRRKIAVIPGYSKEGSFEIGGESKNAYEVADDITHNLVVSLTKTRKFTVLDREFGDAFEQEKALLRSGDVAKDELLKLGNVLGADYLFVFSIDKFQPSDGKVSSITGKTSGGGKIDTRIKYRIITMATRQVKFADDLVVSLKTNGSNAYASATQNIAKIITDAIIDSIYPLKISNVSGDEVVIAQNLKEGDIYDIYKLGEQITDAYTKEIVGQTESMTGQAQVVRTTPKMSYLKILSGHANNGDICRPSKSSAGGSDMNTGREDSVVKQAPGGGVVLPF